VKIKVFDGKQYRGPYRDFPNKREAEQAAKEMRASRNMLVRIEKKRDIGINSPVYYYTLWLRSKERG
jgi:hypothetical protein